MTAEKVGTVEYQGRTYEVWTIDGAVRVRSESGLMRPQSVPVALRLRAEKLAEESR